MLCGREEMDPRKEIRRQGGGELARDFFSIHREDVGEPFKNVLADFAKLF